jgi:hypothetical protein
VQAFRELLKKARNTAALYASDFRAIRKLAKSLNDEVNSALRERDNARAALEECQKLNATLREKIEEMEK